MIKDRLAKSGLSERGGWVRYESYPNQALLGSAAHKLDRLIQ
jgi:hypothetical protein